MSLRAFSIANLASHPVLAEHREPWYSAPAVPSFPTREAYQKWMADPGSCVPLFNLIEGENPTLRVSVTNPPHKVHGIVVDYDTPIDAAELASGLARIPPQFPVFAYNKTRRGGVRLVFAFERPIFYYGKDTFKRLMSRAKKELNLTGLFPGLDEELLHDADHTYTAGDAWTVSPASVISSATLGLWLFEAIRKTDDFDKAGIEVPLDVVEKAVHTRFPGRWNGPFTEGSRGIRFWAPEADNPTAAIVRKTGMTAFTGDRPFMSWSDIFGRQFIAQYQEDRIGRAVDQLYCDNEKQYHRQLPDKAWDRCDATVIRRHLKVVFGLSDKPVDGISEIERVMHHLELNKRIEGAIPFPFRRESLVTWNGKNYLNTAVNIRLVQPSTEPAEWGINFAFTSNYLTTLFADDQNLTVFLAWLKVWYESCRKGSPCRGQALFIVGGPGTGKSLLSLEFLATIFGGYAGTQSFFVEDSKFNSSMFAKALWTLDDQTIIGDRKKLTKFSGLVKSCVANPHIQYAQKYGYEGHVPFEGRLVVTLNEDPASLGILPNTDDSLLDKATMLRTGTAPAAVLGSPAENHEAFERDLPAFLRWLCDWEIPADKVTKDVRFGICAWQDPLVLKEAQSVADSTAVMEAVEIWIRDFTPEKPGAPWVGSASELLGLMLIHDTVKVLVRSLNPVTFGRHLSQAVHTCKWIRRVKTKTNFKYHISKKEEE